MIRKIALIGAASLFATSLAFAQSGSPSSTAGGAQGTSKQGVMDKAPKQKKGTTGASSREQESSPSSTAGGAQGTMKNQKKGAPRN